MPSDDRRTEALAALAAPREAFRSALAQASDQLRALLAEQRGPTRSRAAAAAAELGSLGSVHIDAERFADLFAADDALSPLALRAVEEAQAALADTLARLDELLVVEVGEGESLRERVAAALARAGRAFAAVRRAEAARAGRAFPAPGDGELEPLEPRRWSRAERACAPPLVVLVPGTELEAAGLADLLDGAQKIVLVVEGECPPAPLARLVSPGVLVMQTADVGALARVGAAEGPAVAALVPEGAARFTHEPARREGASARLEIEHLPEAPRHRVGAVSAFRQRQDLELLALLGAGLAAAARTVEAAAAAGPPPAPTDLLAAWLIRQAALPEAH